MARAHCYECGTHIEVAIYDDAALSGSVIPVCVDCKGEVPEDTLWDANALQNAHEQHPDSDNPNLPEPPLANDEDWTIQNRYRDEETFIEHLRASWTGNPPKELEVDLPDDDHWDIFVHDANDENAIREAREALRKKK